jgi:hypothetical protein
MAEIQAEKKCVQDFGQETSREEITWESWRYVRGY